MRGQSSQSAAFSNQKNSQVRFKTSPQKDAKSIHKGNFN
jgi:hypothetical protein